MYNYNIQPLVTRGSSYIYNLFYWELVVSEYTIGKLSKLTKCKVPTIRYYEEIEILPKAARSEGNQRRYTGVHLQRLNFVRHCRALGFNLDEVRQLIHLQTYSHHNPHEVQQIAQQHLKDVLDKIKKLQALSLELQGLMKCCASGKAHNCQILNALNE